MRGCWSKGGTADDGVERPTTPPCEICGEAVRYVEEYAGGFKVFEYEPCARCDLLRVPDEAPSGNFHRKERSS